MLQQIRDKITGWVASIFLGAIAVVFVFWGIDFQSSAGNYAAKVNGERIAPETVRRAWQQRQSQLQQMLRDELPPDMIRMQQTALLEQFVRQELLTQRAEEFGYSVTDEALARRVMEVPQFQVDGKFSADRYTALLRSSGMSETQFESELREELLITQLQTALIESAFVTPHELERRYALDAQQREVDYALIAASDFASSVNITDADIQKYYEQNRAEFMLPEKATVQYIELTRARAEQGVQVTDEALREYFEQVKDRFTTAERRHARHILITTGEGVDDAAAQKKAEQLAAQAKQGADFAKLATDNSKDPGSAQQGGDLGWAERGMFVGPFEDALFAMQPNEIRGPIKTQFGYHVIKLEAIEAGRSKTFDEARVEIEDEFRRDRAQSAFYDETQKLADTAFSSLTELDSVAKAMNLPIRTIEGFTREAGGGELGNDPSVIEAVFSEDVLERGQNSPLVTIGDDRALVLRVSNRTPAEPRPLAEVREQIATQLRSTALRDAAASKGAQAVARLQKGEPWETVTASMGLKPVGKRFVTRRDGIVPPSVADAAFKAAQTQVSVAKPFVTGLVTDDNNYAVVAVSQIRDGDAASEPEQQKTARKRRAEAQLGNEELAGYVAEAERTADVVKNEKVFE